MNTDNLIETKLSSETMFRGKIFTIEHWQVRLPDGKTALREIALHVPCVAVVPVDADGNVTVVYQYRPAIGRVTLEIPAGKLDSEEEDSLEAAKRELREETGLLAEKWTRMSEFISSVGCMTERITLYLAEGLTQAETDPDEDEFLYVEKLPMTELLDRILRGEIEDSKSQSALLLAARRLGL